MIKMIEQYTEELTLKEMKLSLGENKKCFVFPQGDIEDLDKINNILKKVGGKPKKQELQDFEILTKGKSLPDFIISFKEDLHTIIVIECKKNISKHSSSMLDSPKDFAVDGALFYAKHLKESYNVIAIGVSGTSIDKFKTTTFYWKKGENQPNKLSKINDILLEPHNYLNIIQGKKLEKEYSIDDIRVVALKMHEYLREIKMSERHKPLFIAGILISLKENAFLKNYHNYTSFDHLLKNLILAIETVLEDDNLSKKKIDYIKQAFTVLSDNTKFKEIPLGHFKSLTWYIEELELKIKPMMDNTNNTADALGIFYHEFIKYSGGDGKGLGIVLTPQHLTEFMVDLADISKDSRVVDICCGSASFLVTAMSKMFSLAKTDAEREKIRRDGLYGVEFDPELHVLALANMIIRKDGKSNIIQGDCFNKKNTKFLKEQNINVGLINPPYSQKDREELEFVEHMLDILSSNALGVCVVPMSCAIGTKFKQTRERLFSKHKLLAVFSMPDDIFYPTGTNVCVMVWQAHTPHNPNEETFFGYYKEDGFEKRKKLGRIDVKNRWESIKKEWLYLYKNKDVKIGMTARKAVNHSDEWLCEAYMQTDYSKLKQDDFEQTIRDYAAYLVKNGVSDNSET